MEMVLFLFRYVLKSYFISTNNLIECFAIINFINIDEEKFNDEEFFFDHVHNIMTDFVDKVDFGLILFTIEKKNIVM